MSCLTVFRFYLGIKAMARTGDVEPSFICSGSAMKVK